MNGIGNGNWRIVTPDQAPQQWDEFVAGHPRSTIFHTRAMVRAFHSTRHHTPLALAAVDSAQQVRAVLVAVQVSTLGRWANQFAARSIFFAEPIYEDSERGRAAAGELIRQHDQQMRRQVLFAEVRPAYEPPRDEDPLRQNGYTHLGYLNYEVPLVHSEETLWKNVDSGTRNRIRSAHRRGLTIREADVPRELDQFYAPVQHSYALSKVPLADRSLFTSVFRELAPDQYRVLLAEYEGRVVASMCFLAYRRRVLYWYGGAERITGIAASACLLWEGIRWCREQGCELLDTGGAGWPGEDYGPGRFKSKFGGELTQFGRYRRIYAPWKMRCAQSVYSLARGILAPTARAKHKAEEQNAPSGQVRAGV